MKRPSKKGFTLIEVMFALSILGLGLVVLIKSAAGSVFNAEQAHMMGVATDLGRYQMNEIEETMLKDGFQDTDFEQDWKDFSELGWPTIKYSYKIEVATIPTFEQLTQMASGSGAGSALGSAALGSGSNLGSGSGYGSAIQLGEGVATPLSGFQNSFLGQAMSSMFGGLSGGQSVASSGAASLIQSQYSTFQEILKDSVRKVTLHIKYQVLGSDRTLDFVAFYTDGAAIDRTLNGLGAADSGSGSGSSSGSASGSGKGSSSTGTKKGSGS
ncbi:MAG: type II secretion system protein [Kofleriaceae bacterium]